MEQPYKGRAIFQDNFNELQIIIPTKRNWFVILFIGAWLCGWFFGEVFAIRAVTGLWGGNSARLFILFWLVAWTVGGFFALKTFLWNLKGKEIITVGQGTLSVDKKGAFLFKKKIFDLNEIKNIRVQDDNVGYSGLLGGRRADLGAFNAGGPIRFDYGLQTVKFAGGLDEAEAKFVIQELKGRHLLTEKNFS